MSWNQRATIIILVVIAAATWGLGLRAILLAGARAEPKSTASTTVAEAPVEDTPRTSTLPATPTSPLNPTQTLTPTPFPTGMQPTLTPSPTAIQPTTSISWPTATPTQVPSPTPWPTATLTQAPTPSPSPALPTTTPTVPKSDRFLLVDQDEQMMHVYESDVEVRTIPVSTGIPVANAFTPAWRGDVGRYWGGGPFLNTNLWSDYMWYLFPGTRGSILIHSVPYTREGDDKVYDRLDALGVEPASHGCVRISPADAQWLKAWDPVGVPIEITSWSGEIGPPDDSL